MSLQNTGDNFLETHRLNPEPRKPRQRAAFRPVSVILEFGSHKQNDKCQKCRLVLDVGPWLTRRSWATIDPMIAFIWAVADHWVASMSGVVALAVGLIQYFRKKPLAPSLWIAVGAAALLVATYQAWSDENAARVLAECRLARLHTARDQRHEFIVQRLRDYYTQAQDLLSRDVKIDEIEGWKQETTNFAQRAGSWVKLNMGSVAVSKLRDITSGPNYDFGTPDLDGFKNALNRMSANLAVLMQQPDWDEFTPPPAPDCK